MMKAHCAANPFMRRNDLEHRSEQHVNKAAAAPDLWGLEPNIRVMRPSRPRLSDTALNSLMSGAVRPTKCIPSEGYGILARQGPLAAAWGVLLTFI
jgi:hypothetical protein